MIDAHIHIQAMSPDKLLKAKKAGVSAWFVNAAEKDDWAKIEALAAEMLELKPFYGLHPWYAGQKGDNYAKELSAFLEKYPKAGVGEIGLDKLKPWDGQEELFKMQLEIAARYNRVVSVHAVKAASEVLYALQEYKNKLPAIIMHAFAGPVHLVPAFKDCGAYFSISPFFLRKKPKIQKQLLSAIPWERLLLETDAPDGAEPDFLPEMIQKIAEIASFAPEELRKITAENAKRLLSHE